MKDNTTLKKRGFPIAQLHDKILLVYHIQYHNELTCSPGSSPASCSMLHGIGWIVLDKWMTFNNYSKCYYGEHYFLSESCITTMVHFE